MNASTPVRPPVAVVVERCSVTGLTKPECHCAACLAALVASHRSRGRP